MRRTCQFYICPICFATSQEPGQHHDHAMIFCKQLPLDDDRLKPLMGMQGDLKSRAPRWFLEAVWDAADMSYPATPAS